MIEWRRFSFVFEIETTIKRYVKNELQIGIAIKTKKLLLFDAFVAIEQ